MPRIVPGYGPLNAKIVIVGEAPGREEELEGEPFVGSSGRLLNDMLVRCGIDRKRCWLTNVMKTRPNNNDFGLFYVDKGRREQSYDLKESIGILTEVEIESIKPNLIIALGAEPLRALTGKRSIEKWRGSLIETPFGKVLPTYHPAYILRRYEWRAICELDLRKAQRHSHFPELRTLKRVLEIQPSLEQTMNYLGSIKDRVAFDIETGAGFIRCLGLATSPELSHSIPFTVSSGGSRAIGPLAPKGRLLASNASENEYKLGSYWTLDEEAIILKQLDKIFRDPKIELIAQHFPFDASKLAREFGFEFNNLWMDTMVAQHCCYSELPKSLDFLCSMYTDEPRYSDYNPESDLSTWRYNNMDCVITFEVALALEKEMKELGVWDFYRNLAQPAMVALARAGNRGVLVDLEAREKLGIKTEAKIEKIKKDIDKGLGREFNSNSPKQVQKLFYQDFKITPITRFDSKQKKNVVTTNEEALQKIATKYPQHKPLIDLILDYRGETKLLGTFIRSELSETGRLPTSYNATGTVTGRISSSTTIDGLGGNLQQIPRGSFRRIFIAPPGKILIKADLSQAEARVVAWIAGIDSLIEKFQDPSFDVHTYNASLIFGIPLDKVTKDQRTSGKSSLHSANYMGSPATAVKRAKVPYHVAKRALDRYKASIPELEKWWSRVEDEIGATRMLRTPLGRLRIFMGRLNRETIRSAVAFEPQSTVGDIINRAFFKLSDKLPQECYPILQVHDEIVVEALESKKFKCIELIRDALEIFICIKGVRAPLRIPCEIKTGPNWFDMK